MAGECAGKSAGGKILGADGSAGEGAAKGGVSLERNTLREGKTGVDLSLCVLPCFAAFGDPDIPRCWGKQHNKCHRHTRFGVPQMLVKART